LRAGMAFPVFDCGVHRLTETRQPVLASQEGWCKKPDLPGMEYQGKFAFNRQK